MRSVYLRLASAARPLVASIANQSPTSGQPPLTKLDLPCLSLSNGVFAKDTAVRREFPPGL